MNTKQVAYFLRSLTPAPVREGLARAGQFIAAGLPHDPNFPSVYRSLNVLARLGFRPNFCVDVGAYHGEWTKIFKSVFPGTRIFMVEAQEAKRPILERVAAGFGDVSMEIALLGPREGEQVRFHEMETGSSVFAESSPYQRKTTERTTRTLDGIVSAAALPRVDFLKLDVQGYELEVLKGAPRILQQAEAVLMETSLVPVNAGCPPFAEVIASMATAGFRLFDFCSQVRRTDGVLWQTDLLFLREGSPFLPDPQLTKENWG